MFLDCPIDTLLAPPDLDLRGVAGLIQSGEKQIALVVDQSRRLLGTITDGDIRRAVLDGTPMTTLAEDVMAQDFSYVAVGASEDEILELMRVQKVRHVPVLNEGGAVVDLVWISDMIVQPRAPMSAVLMAGGLGERLHPLTKDTPKPLLHVGEKPVMERIVDQLRNSGIHHVRISTHYKGSAIVDHFGNGERFGVDITYLEEEEPLGTAGALGHVEEGVSEPILVVNGDLVTSIDYRAMLHFHEDHDADMTIGVRQYDVAVEYGVVETNGVEVMGIREKPTYSFFVNAGIYLLQPEICNLVPRQTRLDMDDLIHRALSHGKTICSFPISEYWVDIGQMHDYERANRDINREAGST